MAVQEENGDNVQFEREVNIRKNKKYFYFDDGIGVWWCVRQKRLQMAVKEGMETMYSFQ